MSENYTCLKKNNATIKPSLKAVCHTVTVAPLAVEED